MSFLVTASRQLEVEGVAAVKVRKDLEGKLFLEGDVPSEAVFDNFMRDYRGIIDEGDRVTKVDKKYKLLTNKQEEPIHLSYGKNGLLVSRGETQLSFPCESPEKLQEVIIQLLMDQHFKEKDEGSGIYEWRGEDKHHRSLRIRTIGNWKEGKRKLNYTLVSKGERNSFHELYSQGLTYTLESEFITESVQGKIIFESFLRDILMCSRHKKKDKFKRVHNFNLDFNKFPLPLEYIEFAGNILLEAEHMLPYPSDKDSIQEALKHIHNFYDSVGLTPYLIKSGRASDLRS